MMSNVEHHQGFGKIKDGLILLILMVGFSDILRYFLGRKSVDDERQIKRWKGIVCRFKGKLVEMIKDVGGKFDHYSILPKIRQILFHWGYELVESDLF